jgi:hypothetical protein
VSKHDQESAVEITAKGEKFACMAKQVTDEDLSQADFDAARFAATS